MQGKADFFSLTSLAVSIAFRLSVGISLTDDLRLALEYAGRESQSPFGCL